jgi:hypothetical protein
MGRNSLIEMEVWVDGSIDTRVKLSRVPEKGDKVCTPSYFNYRIYDIEYHDGGKIRLKGQREF